MKKALTFSLLLLAVALWGQSPSVYDCLEEDKNIRTYPPEAYNPECGGQYLNSFDWTAEYWPVPYSSYLNMDSVSSPFYNLLQSFYPEFSESDWKDHYPEDGWELIKGPQYARHGYI